MQEEKSKEDRSTILLIVFVVVIFITTIVGSTTQNLVGNWYNRPALAVFLLCLQIIRTSSYLLPAFAIKNKKYKITGIILSSIAVAYLLFSPIMTMLKLNQTN